MIIYAENNSQIIPQRFQRKRIKGWRKPDNSISVCRPSKWGNPFTVGKSIYDNLPYFFNLVFDQSDYKLYKKNEIVVDNKESVRLFDKYVIPKLDNDDVIELKGKHLLCWCKIGDYCHADSLLKAVNK